MRRFAREAPERLLRRRGLRRRRARRGETVDLPRALRAAVRQGGDTPVLPWRRRTRRQRRILLLIDEYLDDLADSGVTHSVYVQANWAPDQFEDEVAMFGANRCLFGSNFPIEKLWTSYRALLGGFLDAASALDPVARAAIFEETATRVYRL